MTARGERTLSVSLSLLFSVAFIEFRLFSVGGLSSTSSELLIGLFVVLSVLLYGKKIFRFDGVAWGLLAVAGSMIVTSIVEPANRFAAAKFIVRFGAGIALYLCLRATFAEARHVRTALRALVAASVAFSAIGLFQHYFPNLLDPLLSLIVPNKFAPFDPTAPLAFTTGIFFDGKEFVVRASSIFGYCNTFSYFLVIALGAAVLLALHDGDRYWKRGALFSTLLNIWALWATFSRGAWLALIAALLTGVSTWLYFSRQRGRTHVVAALVALLFCCTAAVVVGFNHTSRASESQAATKVAENLSGGTASLDTLDTRLRLWRAAVAMWRSSPLFGVGVDRFRFAYHDFLAGDNYDLSVGQGLYQPHNIFLTALAWQGLLGFAALLLFLACLARSVWKQYAQMENPRLAVVVGMIAGIGAANLYDAMLFDSYPHMILIAMTLGLLGAEGWRRG